MNIISRLSQNKALSFSIIIAVLLTVSFFINFNGSFVVTDPDGYYHIRHAWIYGINGIFDTSFPWTQFSVTRTIGGDLWYGFHLFLIPFTFISDPVWGIKIAGVVITFIALFLYFLSFRRLNLKLSLFWPVVLPLFSPTLLARFSVTRPHPLSVGFNVLLFSYLIRGGVWPVFLISFLSVFIHLNLFWVPILTLVVISCVRMADKQPLEKNKGLALLSGVVAGALFRPHPLATLQLNYIQLPYLMIQKMKGLKLLFGSELYPVGLANLPIHFLIIFMVLVLVFVWLAKKHSAGISATKKITMLTLMVMTTLYLVLTVFVVGRSIDFFVGYLLLFAAFNLTFYFDYELGAVENRADKLKGFVLTALIISLAGYNGVSLLNGYGKYLSSEANPYIQKSGIEWIEKNSKPGEIVFHLDWARFPQLFFWNQHNYYISAMDPIFLFAYDQKLYWESHFLSTGEGGEFTCSYRRCIKEEAIRTDVVLKDHFKASYVYITSKENRFPNLLFYMMSVPKKYQKVMLNGDMAIFKVL